MIIALLTWVFGVVYRLCVAPQWAAGLTTPGKCTRHEKAPLFYAPFFVPARPFNGGSCGAVFGQAGSSCAGSGIPVRSATLSRIPPAGGGSSITYEDSAMPRVYPNLPAVADRPMIPPRKDESPLEGELRKALNDITNLYRFLDRWHLDQYRHPYGMEIQLFLDMAGHENRLRKIARLLEVEVEDVQSH